MNRLHIHEIASVGCVAEGDAPEASILFRKRAPTLTAGGVESLLRTPRIAEQTKNPAMTRKEIEAEILRRRPDIKSVLKSPGSLPSRGSGLSAADKTALVAKVRLDMMDESLEELKRATEESQRTLDEIKTMRGTNMTRSEATAGGVRSEVDRLAASMVKNGEAANLIEARPMVWQQRPDLVKKSRQEAPESASSASGKTINDRVREVIDEVTRKASWQPLMKGWEMARLGSR